MMSVGIKRAILVAIVAVFAICQTLNFTGFCYGSFRYLTDKEFKDIGVKYVLSSHDNDPSLPKFSSLEQFYESNPNCCVVHRGRHHLQTDGIWVRAFGWYVALLDIEYRFVSQPENEYFSAVVWVSACGKVRDFGTSRTRRNPAPLGGIDGKSDLLADG
jgi:hypothetical protein